MMQLGKIILVFMALLLVSVSALAEETDSLQSALQSIMHQHKIPDLSVSVIRSGKIVYAADLHQQNDGTLQIGPGVTRFRIASITKLFTAQAAMQLIEKRTLSLDDKVAVYQAAEKLTFSSNRLPGGPNIFSGKIWLTLFCKAHQNKY